MLVSLAFIGAYYFFYAKAGDLLRELLANAALYGDTIRSGAYPLYLVGRVAVGDAGAIATVAAVTLGLFALVWYLIARSFLRLATSTGAVAKVVYRERAVGLHSPDRALLGRELRRFTASANYMLNCGMGILGMVVAAVALIWKGRDFLRAVSLVLPVDTETVSVLLCAAVCALISMNDMAAPSVSLEGKSLWLAQSLPVTAWQVLRAKLRMHLLLTAVPGAVLGVCLVAVCDFLRPAEPVFGPENAQSPLDQRDHPHQAERGGGYLPAGRLGLCGGDGGPVFSGGPAHGLRGIHGGLPCPDAGCRRAAVYLGEEKGLRHFRLPVKKGNRDAVCPGSGK